MGKSKEICEIKKELLEFGYNWEEGVYDSSKSKLVLKKDGYKFYLTYNQVIKGHNPLKWGKCNPFSIDNLNIFVNKNNGNCTVYDYKNNIVYCECVCGVKYSAILNNFIRNKQFQCPKCGRKRSAENHVKNNYKAIIENSGLVLVGKYNGCKHSSIWKDSEGYLYSIYPYNFAKWQRTIQRNKFSEANPCVDHNFANYIKLNNLKCSYVDGSFTKSHKDIELICQCGNHYKYNAFFFRYFNADCCSICSKKYASSYEKAVFEYLKEKGVNFETQKTFPEMKQLGTLRIDFYVPSLQKAIEVDGKQHYEPIEFFKAKGMTSEETFNNLKERDKIKEQYCESHGITLLRIPYSHFDNNKYKIDIDSFIG